MPFGGLLTAGLIGGGLSAAGTIGGAALADTAEQPDPVYTGLGQPLLDPLQAILANEALMGLGLGPNLATLFQSSPIASATQLYLEQGDFAGGMSWEVVNSIGQAMQALRSGTGNLATGEGIPGFDQLQNLANTLGIMKRMQKFFHSGSRRGQYTLTEKGTAYVKKLVGA